MKKDIVITIDNKTSMVYKDVSVLGINNENLQSNIIFKFSDEFVNGTAWLEFERNSDKGYVLMSKENDTYTLPIKQSLLSEQGKIYFQLRITQEENNGAIPVFKSNKFYLDVKEAINSTTSIKDDYPDILDILDTKLDKTNIKAGKNVELDVVGKDITINVSSSASGTSNYEELENKPKINNVELNGNKTLDELGINIPTNSDFTLSGLKEKSYNSLSDKPIIPIVPTDVSAFTNDSGYITKDVDNLTNYTKTSDMPTIPTKVSELDNDKGYISDYTETDPTVPSYVKSISESDINNWNSMINSSSDQTISGVKTYSVLPVSEVLPTNDDQFTIKQYVDNSIATALGTIETTLQTINSGSGV